MCAPSEAQIFTCNPRQSRKKWLSIADVLSKIPNLRTFSLQGMDHVSVALLDALEKHRPHAHLHIEDWARFDDDEDHNNAAEIALASSRNLRSLRARLLNTSAHIDLRSAALERIVALSPGLEVLEVSNFGLFQGTPQGKSSNKRPKCENNLRKTSLSHLTRSGHCGVVGNTT